MDNRDVRQVIAVFKTHLDIGFTSLAADVLQRYREKYIPSAIALAKAVNTDRQKRFVWTVGSYLIHYALSQAPEEERAALEAAIRRGDLRYHALPCTTHTELMDRELFEYGLSISKNLDRRFALHTIAAKMTDVPGHTIAMVPLLAHAGVEYLHIGVNAASRVPDLPPLFRWLCGDSEIVVNYAGSYGDRTVLPNGIALEFCHAPDNSGPPSPEGIHAIYEALARRYPHARIAAGTLDEFALTIRDIKDSLPVVKEEIGDTWIHGVASDPLKVSRFRRLLSLKTTWRKSGTLTPQSHEYGAFMEPLLLVAEHTWGLDCKKYLLDFSNWSKTDFQAARARDTTSYALFSPRNVHLLAGLRDELRQYRRENETSSYSLFEASHTEQRAYIDRAIAALPARLAAEANRDLSFSMPEPRGTLCRVKEPIQIGDWLVVVGREGQIERLVNPKKELAMRVSFGLFEYETFDGKDTADCFFQYGRDLKENFHWAECDFDKPGLRYEKDIRHRIWRTSPERILLDDDTLYIVLRPRAEACEKYGCPRELLLTHRFGDSIKSALYWRHKDAIRSPEALWLRMTLSVSEPNLWRMQKLGTSVSPMSVARGGNRKLHCVERLSCEGADGAFSITPHDSPLVSIGGRHLYHVDDKYGDPAKGFWFLLCDNRWGTNFKQWFEDDMRFVYETELRPRPSLLLSP